MKNSLYKIAGWILIIAGIITAILTIYFSFGGPTTADRLYELGSGLLFAILIFVLAFFPGKFFLKIEEAEQNKSTNWSLGLTLTGIGLIIIALISMLITCPPPRFCDGAGLAIIFFGIFPAGVLYAISVILLIINKFKK